MKSVSEEISSLSDQIKTRDIQRLVYFHCDHFEPWQVLPGHGMFSQRHIDDLSSFVDDLAKIDYARKLTLFYKPHLSWQYSDSTLLLRAHPDDPLGFVSPPPKDAQIAKEGMGNLARNSQHELQFHLHHEGLTYNTSHQDPQVLEFYKRPDAREIDNYRIATALELLRKAILDEAGIDLRKWFFVHGQWALQASDDRVCCITNEIEILMKAGCLGDFTFPAGREPVNPLLDQPFFCRSIDMAKGYDSVQSEPEFAYGNAEAAKSKFFIWSSRIWHNRSSIDYYAKWVRTNLENPAEWARDIVDKSVAIDGTLYVKTHSHSMYPYYRALKRRPIYPHAHPGVQTLLGLVFDAAASAGCAVEFKTASEIYAEFCNPPPAAESKIDAASSSAIADIA